MITNRIYNNLRVALKPSALAFAAATWLTAGTALAAPANDNFANAINLTGTTGTQTGTDTIGATLEVGEPNPGASNTVWFKWTCPADGDFTFNTFDSTNSIPDEWDSIIGIYTGAALNALTPLGATPKDTVLGETMTVAVTAGTTYFIQLAGYADEAAVNIQLNWNFVATVYEANILTFGPYDATIGAVVANAADIAWTVPFGANLATLAPTFTLSPGATCTVGGSPVVSGTPVNFSGGPRVFTVTAQGGSPVNSYTVTVAFAPNESALVWNLAGGGDWDFVTANWLGQTSLTTQPFSNVLNVIFDKTSGGTINIPASVIPLTTTVSAASGTYTFSGGPLSGTGLLTKSGNGNLTITTANNTYTGGTVINGGQLKMDVLANAALGTGPVTLNGGRLFLERITATNALIVNGGNIWPDNGFGDNWNGPVTLNSNLIIQGPGYATTTFNGIISGAGGLTLNGQGQVVLAVANSYTGPTSVTSCTLRCNHVNALGSGALSISSAPNSKVNLNYSGTRNITGLTLGGIAQTSGTHGSIASGAAHPNDTYFTPGSTGTVTVPASSSKNMLTFNFGALGVATIGASTITLEVPFGTNRTALAPTYTVSPGATASPLSGTTLNFTGPQIYTVTAEDLSTKAYTVTVTEAVLPNIFTWANASSGDWSVAANWTNEELTVASPLAGGRTSYTLNFNTPGTYTATNNLSVGFKLNQLNLGAAVSLAGNGLALVSNGPTLPTINQNSGSGVTSSNNLDLGSNTTFGGSGGGEVGLTGLISGAGSLIKNGPSTLRIYNVDNSFTGGTTISSGTLWMDINAKLGTGPISLNGGVLWMWRFKPTNALIVNGGSITSENGFNENLLAGPVTLNATLPVNAPFQLTCSNTISGVGGLTKTGNGPMILSATCTSTYTGPTTVTAGTLRCDSPAAVASGALSINGGVVNLNYAGNKTVSSLTLGGVAQTTPGTYGSVASGANFPSDTYFTTGSTGTVTVGGANPYATWSGGAAFNSDANNDGVGNGMAWMLGALDKNANATGLLPAVSQNAGNLVLTFTCLKVAGRGGAVLSVQHSSDLGITDAWASAVVPDVDSTVNGVVFDTTDNGNFINVVATIPAGEAAASKLFGRLDAKSAP